MKKKSLKIRRKRKVVKKGNIFFVINFYFNRNMDKKAQNKQAREFNKNFKNRRKERWK